MVPHLKVMQIVGRAEVLAFPKLGIPQVKAKVDTGADSSAIHATRIKVSKSGEKEQLSCWLLGKGPFLFTEYQRKSVKSSNGSSEKRYAIKLSVQLGSKVYKTWFTLTNRNKMSYPILLGKKFLRGKFIVDVSKKNTIPLK
ncbi:ATP-dependent zinc protease family protein [Luteibaculum oceani]|uniref:ATP-dependent zinc protease family protein n=1 Tax=Luteibaculum oceani TaxID=1294296 RepID=UPI0014770873|nr:RimK/LysX family protein [Luteibaculum oceani]